MEKRPYRYDNRKMLAGSYLMKFETHEGSIKCEGFWKNNNGGKICGFGINIKKEKHKEKIITISLLFL